MKKLIISYITLLEDYIEIKRNVFAKIQQTFESINNNITSPL
jgi:hypothetical protein